MSRVESMMDLSMELNLGHKPDFDRIFYAMQPEVSDFTFTNMFMCQYSYG
mgnify:CR=1 FL=1